jgi:hypothetical protein
MLPCCIDQRATNRAATNDLQEQQVNFQGSEIIEKILTLPEFKYHEESRKDFSRRLIAAQTLSQNRQATKDYLYCPGDGTFPPREFIWDEHTNVMIVKCFGSEIASPHVDRWRKSHGKWVQM